MELQLTGNFYTEGFRPNLTRRWEVDILVEKELFEIILPSVEHFGVKERLTPEGICFKIELCGPV